MLYRYCYKRQTETLPYAVLSIENTNISTVTNSEGSSFKSFAQTHTIICLLHFGHENLRIPLTSLCPSGTESNSNRLLILPEITVLKQEPELIIRKMRTEEELQQDKMMTAFIVKPSKRNTNVSLAEAIVEVYKRDYRSALHDMAALYNCEKVRTTAD